MSDIKYSTYSSKGINALGTGAKYGVNEMTETAFSMGLNTGRRTVVEGITKDIENQFLNDIVQDGLSAGLGYFSGQAMQIQEDVLSSAFKSSATIVGAWYTKSLAKKTIMRGLKGRKLGMLSKWLGSNDKKVEECRLIADFAKMDLDTTSNSQNPIAHQKRYESKYKHESLEVSKEGVRASLSKLQIDGMRDSFDMKIKTSSFFVTDKNLIKKMTGLQVVTDKDIKKLNALSRSMVVEDSNGNYIGGNQVMSELLSSLNLQRAN